MQEIYQKNKGEEVGKRVLDLNSGLGGRIYAFEKAGFEIVAAVDNDFENCEIMTSWMAIDKIINCNLFEVDPDLLPDADIITAKYCDFFRFDSPHRIHSMLIPMDDSRECVVCAKNIRSVNESHEWIGTIVKQMGVGEQAYSMIMDVVSEHELWEKYVRSVYEWIKGKKEDVELICVNE